MHYVIALDLALRLLRERATIPDGIKLVARALLRFQAVARQISFTTRPVEAFVRPM